MVKHYIAWNRWIGYISSTCRLVYQQYLSIKFYLIQKKFEENTQSNFKRKQIESYKKDKTTYPAIHRVMMNRTYKVKNSKNIYLYLRKGLSYEKESSVTGVMVSFSWVRLTYLMSFIIFLEVLALLKRHGKFLTLGLGEESLRLKVIIWTIPLLI